ncbi:MAG TPA: HPr(Ser) kinase/phosphatase [Burkholderiaceae bacterium]|nr:HPr(Ser) kinase/phosphatase [Burkholderiaceae bacterium]
MTTVRRMFDENASALGLELLAGVDGDNTVLMANSNAAGVAAADIVGHLNLIHPGRIQVFGHEEYTYLTRMDKHRREHLLRDLLGGKPPALILAEGLQAYGDLRIACDAHAVPLYSSPATSAEVIDVLRIWFAKRFAQTKTMHGVFMDVLGLGVLITGESGLGKSELALELISRGHGLIADDAVELSRIAPNYIEGRCPPLLQNLLEVRGLGLLDIKAIFGETAVRRKLRLRLIVHLVRRQTLETEYERLPLEALTQDVLGLPIRKVVIPVAAGRNLAVLLEAAVRNTVLQLRGIDTMKEFIERQKQAMQPPPLSP